MLKWMQKTVFCIEFILIKFVFNMLGCASKCSIVIGAHGVLEPLGGIKHLLLLSTKRYNK